MRLFRYWTREQCTEAILALEEGLATGVHSISYPAGGSLAYTSLSNASKLLQHLYSRLDDLNGKKRRPSIQFIQHVVKRGW